MKYLPSNIVVTRFVYIRATAEIIISQFSTVFVPSKIPKISYLFFYFLWKGNFQIYQIPTCRSCYQNYLFTCHVKLSHCFLSSTQCFLAVSMKFQNISRNTRNMHVTVFHDIRILRRATSVGGQDGGMKGSFA